MDHFVACLGFVFLFNLLTCLGNLVKIGLLYPPVMFEHDFDGMPQPLGNRSEGKLSVLAVQEVGLKRRSEVVNEF